MLLGPSTVVAGVDFIYHLLKYSVEQMSGWWAANKNSDASQIILPRKDSISKSWAIVVIKRGKESIEVVDAKFHSRTFYPIFPRIMTFV